MKEIFYDWGGFNVWLFHAINDIRESHLDRFMQLGTAIGDHGLFPLYLALLTLAALGITVKQRSLALPWIGAIAVFSCAYLLDGLLISTLKPLLDYPRPPLALPAGTVHIVGSPEYHHSTPSGHASFAMLCIASLWPMLNSRLKLIGVSLVLWVGISRVSLGAHFPADVLAGYVSSLAVVLAVRSLVNLYVARRV